MKPYVIIESQHVKAHKLEAEAARLIEQGYEPAGGVNQDKNGVWYQAMYRDPDLFGERETPTTPKSHQDAVDDVILEAFYSDNYPGHPDYKGEVIRKAESERPKRPASTLPGGTVLLAYSGQRIRLIRDTKVDALDDDDLYTVVRRDAAEPEVIRTDDQMESDFSGSSTELWGPSQQAVTEAPVYGVVDYIPPSNLTPAQRKKLSDWLDGKEGVKFPTMKAPDLRAVVNAMRQYMDQAGVRSEARQWEVKWKKTEEIANRALDMAHDRLTRIMELQKENDDLRQEHYEAIERAENAERWLERAWWPDGRPTQERIDSLLNYGTTTESADQPEAGASTNEVKMTQDELDRNSTPTATEVRMGADRVECITFSGGPLCGSYGYMPDNVERFVFQDEQGGKHTYRWTGWRFPKGGGSHRMFTHIEGVGYL